jgi:uncharacterized membrane protein YqjE
MRTSACAGFFNHLKIQIMNVDHPINEFADQFKQYLKTTTEIAKLEVLKRTVQMSAHLILQFLLWGFMLLFTLLSCMALGFYISEVVDDKAKGFAFVAAAIGVLTLIVQLYLAKRMRALFETQLLRRMYQDSI